MSSQYAKGLVSRLREILGAADLATISAKGVRKQLVAQGENEARIKENRSAIDAEIQVIYEELTAGAGADAPSSDEEPLHNSTSLATPQSSQPQPLRSHAPKQEVKEEFKPRITNSAARSEAETDEQMAARLQREFDAMNSRGARASRSSGAARPKKTPKKTKKRSQAGVDNSDEEASGTPKKKRAPNPNNAFNKPLVLSDALADFTGETRLSRPQTVKRIWDYVKEHSMQDPSDKRIIRCDDRLKAVFHTDRLHMFTMNKILSAHFRDPDEVIFKSEDAKPKVEPSGQAPAPAARPARLAPGALSVAELDSDSAESEDEYQ